MLIFIRTNTNGMEVAVDPLLTNAVLNWGPGKVGIRTNHPEPLRVDGEFREILARVVEGKRKAHAAQREENNYAKP